MMHNLQARPTSNSVARAALLVSIVVGNEIVVLNKDGDLGILDAIGKARYLQHRDVNCLPGHGAHDFDKPSGSHDKIVGASILVCSIACDQRDDCSGFVRQVSDGVCYLRTNLSTPDCISPADGFDTYVQVYGAAAYHCRNKNGTLGSHRQKHEGDAHNLEYQCDDGSCISIKGLCNGVANCQDASDEKDTICGPQTTQSTTSKRSTRSSAASSVEPGKKPPTPVAPSTTAPSSSQPLNGSAEQAPAPAPHQFAHRQSIHDSNHDAALPPWVANATQQPAKHADGSAQQSNNSSVGHEAITTCASENAMKMGNCPECTLSASCVCSGSARFGYGSRWSDWKQVVGGIIQCNSVSFEDPFPGHGKICQCKASEASTQLSAGALPASTSDNLQVSLQRKFPAPQLLNRRKADDVSFMAGFFTTFLVVCGVVSVSGLAYGAKILYSRHARREIFAPRRSGGYDRISNMNEETELLADDSELEDGQAEYWQPVE